MKFIPYFAAEPIKVTPDAVGFPSVSLGTGVTSIVSTLLVAAGVLAVIFILIGALQYVMSGGDPGSTRRAKDTLLYAIIGLIISISALAIIGFVTDRL